jgi:hypothetical protein
LKKDLKRYNQISYLLFADLLFCPNVLLNLICLPNPSNFAQFENDRPNARRVDVTYVENGLTVAEEHFVSVASSVVADVAGGRHRENGIPVYFNVGCRSQKLVPLGLSQWIPPVNRRLSHDLAWSPSFHRVVHFRCCGHELGIQMQQQHRIGLGGLEPGQDGHLSQVVNLDEGRKVAGSDKLCYLKACQFDSISVQDA